MLAIKIFSKHLPYRIFITTILFGFITLESKSQVRTDESMLSNMLFPKGERAPANNFTGTVWLSPLITNDSVFTQHIASVTFEPGARTYWHRHPGGQVLLVIDGMGWYQERGGAVRTIRKGDVIKCSPDIEHWHGATTNTPLVHIGITNNHPKGRAEWLKTVTDEEYNKLK